MQMKTVNDQIHKKVSKFITLYKGDGYFYFEYAEDTFAGLVFETKSVYVCYLYQLTIDQWLEEAETLYQKVGKMYREMMDA